MTEQPHKPGAVELVKDFLGNSHEILPGKLWQCSALGALHEALGSDQPVYVISCIRESVEPPGLAGFLRFPFEDGPELPDSEQLVDAGILGNDWLRSGRVIVHCLAGNNRSGLVVGQIVHEHGFDDGHYIGGPALIALIQKANPHALYNDTFRHYLESL